MAQEQFVDEPSNSPNSLFQIGQRIQAYDDVANVWIDAIVKDISTEEASIKVGWLQAKYSAEKYDKWFVKVDWNTKIRNPYTGRPYRDNSAYNNKHINDWTCNELQQWIYTLTVNNNIKQQIVTAISEQEITGADINTIEEVSEIMDSFEIQENAAAEILSSIQNIRIQTTPNISENIIMNVFDTLFYEGQRIEIKKKTKNEYRPGIVKQVEINRIKIGYLEPRLQDEKYDKWINCNDYDTMIRQPNSDQSDSDQQNQQLENKMEELNDKIDQLENDNLKLKRQFISKEQEINILEGKFQTISSQYYDLQKKNKTAEKVYISMVTQFSKLKEENEELQKETTKLFQVVKNDRESGKANEELKEENVNLKQHIIGLRNENNILTKQNIDLNEECKELKIELKDIKQKHIELVRENSLHSDYKTWDYNTVTDWIIGLNESFIGYEKVLRRTLKEEQLSGGDLVHLDRNDLNRFGIKVFKHKQQIMEEIQKLTAQNNVPG
eukprot:104491_1